MGGVKFGIGQVWSDGSEFREIIQITGFQIIYEANITDLDSTLYCGRLKESKTDFLQWANSAELKFNPDKETLHGA